jgi:hypothetical protein
VRPPRGHIDYIYTFLSATGKTYPFLFVTKKKNISADVLDKKDGRVIVIKHRKKAKRGEGVGAEAWARVVEELIKRKALKRGSVLYTDNESSFGTEDGEGLLAEAGVRHEFFPPIIACFFDPCDNSYHSAFSRNYYKALEKLENPTVDDKVRCALEASKSVSPEAIQHMFEHCGLTGSRDVSAVVEYLIEEGTHVPIDHYYKYARLVDEYYAFLPGRVQRHRDAQSEAERILSLMRAPMLRRPRK